MKGIIGTFLIVLACASFGEGAVVQIGQSMRVTDLPLEIAKEAKLFEKYGIKVQPVIRITTYQLLAACEVDGTVAANASSIVTMNAKGVGVKIVGSLINNQIHTFMVNRDFKEERITEELQGAPIGVLNVTSGASADSYRRIVRILKEKGVDTASLQPVEMPFEAMFTSLVSGRLKGAVVNATLRFKAEKRGLKVLWDFSNESYPFLVIAFQKDFIEKHRQEVESFLKAITEAVRLLRYDHSMAINVLASQFKLSDAGERDFVYSYLSRIVAPNLDLRPRDLVLARGDAEKHFDVSRVIDSSFIDELERSGFLAQFRK